MTNKEAMLKIISVLGNRTKNIKDVVENVEHEMRQALGDIQPQANPLGWKELVQNWANRLKSIL